MTACSPSIKPSEPAHRRRHQYIAYWYTVRELYILIFSILCAALCMTEEAETSHKEHESYNNRYYCSVTLAKGNPSAERGTTAVVHVSIFE